MSDDFGDTLIALAFEGERVPPQAKRVHKKLEELCDAMMAYRRVRPR
jgi:hypothetical protein